MLPQHADRCPKLMSANASVCVQKLKLCLLPQATTRTAAEESRRARILEEASETRSMPDGSIGESRYEESYNRMAEGRPAQNELDRFVLEDMQQQYDDVSGEPQVEDEDGAGGVDPISEGRPRRRRAA